MAYVANMTIDRPGSPLLLHNKYLDIPFEQQGRGVIVPEDKVVREHILCNKIKKIPGIFIFNTAYWLCSEEGREFLNRNAPGQCEFIPINLYHLKGKAYASPIKMGEAVEGKYYWINVLRRHDSVVWGKSEAQLYDSPGYDRDTQERRMMKLVSWPAPPGSIISQPGRGLAIRHDLIGGSQIWRENLAGANGSELIFVSDKMKNQMEKDRIGFFEFIPVQEI